MYRTQNVYLAAALVAHGASYTGVVPVAAFRVAFQFQDPDGSLRGQESLYHRHRMKPIQPAVYVTALDRVRDDLMAARRGQ